MEESEEIDVFEEEEIVEEVSAFMSSLVNTVFIQSLVAGLVL